MTESSALYECKSPVTEAWVECNMPLCSRTRRVNKKVDPLIRLEHYKSKLDAKLILEKIEQDDLNEIADEVAALLEAFVTAVTESLQPALATVAEAVKQLWDSLPEDMREQLEKAPARVGEISVATPLSNVDLNIARYEAAVTQRRSLS